MSPSICKAPPDPDLDPPELWPGVLNCFADHTCESPTESWHETFQVPQIAASPPTYYQFKNPLDYPPDPIEMEVKMMSTDLTSVECEVWFMALYSPRQDYWHYPSLIPRSTQPFILSWQSETFLHFGNKYHRLQWTICETGLTVPSLG